MWLREHAGSRDGVLVSTAYKSSVVGYYSDRPAYGYLPAGNPDPLYRDPGNVRAFVRAGGVRWVVLDHDSRLRAALSESDSGLYDRLVRLLADQGHELAHVVPGPSPDRWLAQVYLLTGAPTPAAVQAPATVGRGSRRIVVISYAIGVAIAVAFVLIARRSAGGSARDHA